jgi:ADP-ribose pyrophosphatase
VQACRALHFALFLCGERIKHGAATVLRMAHEFDEAKTLARREIWRGSVGQFGVEDVQLSDARRFTLAILRHPGACAVVPLLDDGRVLLLRQYRHAVRRTLWEVPAGKLDPGEALEQCALRELKEETGYSAGSLTALGTICVTPGYSDELIHLYLARDLRAGEQALAANESIVCEAMPLAAAVRMAEDGEVSDAKTAIALLRARSAIDRP